METTAQLIARRPERLNILIGKTFDGVDWRGRAVIGNTLQVRYGWSDLDNLDPEEDARTISIHVPGAVRFDRDALNNAGRNGATVVISDVPGIERAVAELRAAWGDIPVQDNSGRCGHLASVPGVLAI